MSEVYPVDGGFTLAPQKRETTSQASVEAYGSTMPSSKERGVFIKEEDK
jgi:hypothetical protein